MFERSSQRERSGFEQVKKNFNIDPTEASEQLKQPSSRRRSRSPERGRRGRREGNKGVMRGARGGDARGGGARGGGARGGVEGGVGGDAAGGTNVPMEDVFYEHISVHK